MPAPSDPQKREIWRKNLSLSHKGRPAWNKGREMSDDFKQKMRELALKFWHDPKFSDQVKKWKISSSEAKKGDKNPMKRLDLRIKHSEWMRGRFVGDKNCMSNPESRKKISEAKKGRAVSFEVRKKISKTLMGKLVGKLNPFYGKHHSQAVKEKSRIRAINQIASGSLRNRRTSIELKILGVLSDRKIEFIEQYPLEGITVVDFYLSKYRVAIYCDGEFWHKGKWAVKNNILQKDLKQKVILESRGYKVFRFDEEKINKSATECVDEVERYISGVNIISYL